MTKSKILSLDYGNKRIGLAISDINQEIAFPRDFLVNDKKILENIKTLCDEEGVKLILIGLPKHMDGKETEQTDLTRLFGDKLQEFCEGIEVKYCDERLTTYQAYDKVSFFGVKEKAQKNEQDSVAAQIILEIYLNQNHG